MWLGEGDDRASIAGNVDTPASINWEGGNDHLNGGGGQSILIGGLGSDRIVGGPADNTLIGGTTLFDRQGDALLSLLQEWSFDLSYPERVANLREGTGPELSGTGFYLRPRDTVSDDDALDLLTGASGLDWFFIDVENDIATDIQLLELTTRAKPEESSST